MSGTRRADAPGVRPPGRPRVEGHDDRIIDAVLTLVDAGRPVTLRAVVETSGVSRAAIYRRWASVSDLVAEALDRGRSAPALDVDLADPTTLVTALLHEASLMSDEEQNRRVRARVVLGMQDPVLRRTAWQRHLTRRRDPLREVLQEGRETGVFRADLDVEAACDLLASIFYYQVVVRADDDAASTCARVEAALMLVLDGMLAQRATTR